MYIVDCRKKCSFVLNILSQMYSWLNKSYLELLVKPTNLKLPARYDFLVVYLNRSLNNHEN